VVYTLNLTGTSSGKAPYELYFNKKPKINNLKTFGIGTELIVTHIPNTITYNTSYIEIEPLTYDYISCNNASKLDGCNE